tara:strand:+ start:1601 stop:1996 length:396 start_codon:yes stop_codon:yes gene_type:complete
MAERFTKGPVASVSPQLTEAGTAAIPVYANTSTIEVQSFAYEGGAFARLLLFYVSPVDVGVLDLNTIVTSCLFLPSDINGTSGGFITLDIGSERTRPSPGFIYCNFMVNPTGGVPAISPTYVSVCQIMENY